MTGDMSMLKLKQLVCDNYEIPIGLSSAKPTFGWKLESDLPSTMQKSYELHVYADSTEIWNSGTVESVQSIHIPYGGGELKPHNEYRWDVMVIDNNGETATSESYFFTGKLYEQWKGKWIGTGKKNDSKNTLPPELFQKNVIVPQKPVKAVIYISAMGIYEAEMNGKKIGKNFFAPGYNHYQTYLQFQTYDVTDLMQVGSNNLGINVANGWWLGTIGNKNNTYGDSRGLIAELHIWYEDGTHTIVYTDESWQYTIDTPLRYADFYNGQIIDETKMEVDWLWGNTQTLTNVKLQLLPHFGAFVTENQRLKIFSKHKLSDCMIYDFGQNHAGVLHLKINAPKDTTITIRHSEIVNENGSLFTENLRSAKQQLTLICGKDGYQEFLPRFTFMGFRYVEVKTNNPIQIVSLESIVLTSDAKAIGEFSCSDPLLTRLHQNIQWSQLSNFIEIPTDCPQRDERMGWTGDIAVFASTAARNRDISVFMRKWLVDLQKEQAENGAIPVTIPAIQTYAPTKKPIPIAIWGDAAVMVPWAIYMAYGDKTLLEEQYDSMKRYTEAERRAAAASGFGKAKYLWDRNRFQYGDWCAPGEGYYKWKRKGKYLSTPYFANSVDIMLRAAKVLGKAADVAAYKELHHRICDAYISRWCREDGSLRGNFQSNYVCALYFGLVPENKKAAVAQQLVKLVRQNNHCIMTGFAGTPYIAFALADNGYVEDAYQLLQNTECPGWLYTVRAGGTTIWERWNALDENGHFYKGGGADMVSFNHYAYGAVGDFFYRRVLGIEPIEAGYKTFRIQPILGGSLTYAKGSLETKYGRIESRWKREGQTVNLAVLIPANTRCTVILPNGEQYEVGSGHYQYEITKGGN